RMKKIVSRQLGVNPAGAFMGFDDNTSESDLSDVEQGKPVAVRFADGLKSPRSARRFREMYTYCLGKDCSVLRKPPLAYHYQYSSSRGSPVTNFPQDGDLFRKLILVFIAFPSPLTSYIPNISFSFPARRVSARCLKIYIPQELNFFLKIIIGKMKIWFVVILRAGLHLDVGNCFECCSIVLNRYYFLENLDVMENEVLSRIRLPLRRRRINNIHRREMSLAVSSRKATNRNHPLRNWMRSSRTVVLLRRN
ncbi:unnamed protein product, partial [Nesidiocoris tenuis]